MNSPNLWTVSTSQMLTELAKREAEASYSVEEIAGPEACTSTRYAIYRDGATRPSGYSGVTLFKRYTAICTLKSDAEDLCSMLNERERLRRAAARDFVNGDSPHPPQG